MTSENQHTKTLKFGLQLAKKTRADAEAIIKKAGLENNHSAEGLARQALRLLESAIDCFATALVESPDQESQDYRDAVNSMFKAGEQLFYAKDKLGMFDKEPE